MITKIPDILKLAERNAVAIEQMVADWPRKHRYTHGSDLRTQAMLVWRLAQHAWRAPAERRFWVGELSKAVDDLKLSLQMGKQIQAFKSFGQFQAIAEPVADLGRRVGGWVKRVNGQNGPAEKAVQRPEILSSQTASHEAMR